MKETLRYWLTRGFLLFLPAVLMASCGHKKDLGSTPPPADPVVVKVAVPVPCKVAEVPKSEDPAVRARKGDDVFTLAKIAAASRRVLLGENGELRAANDKPCG